MYEVNPELDLKNVDVVICRETMARLFKFVTTTSKTVDFDVEIVGGKAVFVRQEWRTTDSTNANLR